MSRFTDAELYLRGRDTLLASWEAYACGAVGAAVKRFPGVAAAVFPDGPGPWASATSAGSSNTSP